MYCSICVAKTKAMISFAATAKVICVFVFAYAQCCFLMQPLIYVIMTALVAASTSKKKEKYKFINDSESSRIIHQNLLLLILMEYL